MADPVSATTALATAGVSDTTPLVVPHLPLLKRVQYGLIVFLWSNLLNKPMLFFSAAKKYLIPPPKKKSDPDLVKTYPVRKHLEIRSVPPFPSNAPPP